MQSNVQGYVVPSVALRHVEYKDDVLVWADTVRRNPRLGYPVGGKSRGTEVFARGRVALVCGASVLLNELKRAYGIWHGAKEIPPDWYAQALAGESRIILSEPGPDECAAAVAMVRSWWVLRESDGAVLWRVPAHGFSAGDVVDDAMGYVILASGRGSLFRLGGLRIHGDDAWFALRHGRFPWEPDTVQARPAAPPARKTPPDGVPRELRALFYLGASGELLWAIGRSRDRPAGGYPVFGRGRMLHVRKRVFTTQDIVSAIMQCSGLVTDSWFTGATLHPYEREPPDRDTCREALAFIKDRWALDGHGRVVWARKSWTRGRVFNVGSAVEGESLCAGRGSIVHSRGRRFHLDDVQSALFFGRFPWETA